MVQTMLQSQRTYKESVRVSSNFVSDVFRPRKARCSIGYASARGCEAGPGFIG